MCRCENENKNMWQEALKKASRRTTDRFLFLLSRPSELHSFIKASDAEAAAHDDVMCCHINTWVCFLIYGILLFYFGLRVCVSTQRHGRVQETQLKCTKARNDYLLNLAAANAAMNKYYLQDVSTLIDVRNIQFVCCL